VTAEDLADHLGLGRSHFDRWWVIVVAAQVPLAEWDVGNDGAPLAGPEQAPTASPFHDAGTLILGDDTLDLNQ